MKRFLALALALLPLATLAQTSAPATAPTPPQAKPAHVSLYQDAPTLDYTAIVVPPPAPDSSLQRAENLTLHHIQATRTPAEIAAAQHDDASEDMFLFDTVLGPRLNPADLPLTAALSAHIRSESGVINPALKHRFQRLRPYNADPTLHPVCDRSTEPSFPSGHAMVGYLEGLALTQMLPELSMQILHRADAFAHNRLICGVHYPTDLEASHQIALALFGSLSASPRFQKELAAARTELRQHLNMP